MKKFMLLFVLVFTLFSSSLFAQTRNYNSRNNTFRFTEDMVNKINKDCPSVLKSANTKNEKLEAFCSVKDIKIGEADLGPWRKMVHAFEKLFQQFRKVIYVAAVFMLLWIFVKAAYEGDMKWMHLSMLIIGVVILAGAEVLIGLATNRITLEDVISDGVYVDCRNKRTNDAFFKCSVDDQGASLYDSRYFLQVSGEIKENTVYKGLF